VPLTYIAGYDGSDASRDAVVYAARLGAAEGAEVTAITAYREVPQMLAPSAPTEAQAALQRDAREEAERTLAALDVPGVGRRAVMGPSPAHVLHTQAEELGASLVAVGATDRGPVGRLAPGSVAMHLLHGSPCPVAVVPAGHGERPITSVGVAYDARPESRAALEEGERLARRLEARLVIIGVYETPLYGPGLVIAADLSSIVRDRVGKDLAEAAARIPDLEVEQRRLDGSAERALADTTRDELDLLVCGSRGYGPVRSVLLGSVSRHIVDHAHCPVLVVPRTAGARLDREPVAAERAET
jgi:nucleotide-binding universal stress UspA family protein